MEVVCIGAMVVICGLLGVLVSWLIVSNKMLKVEINKLENKVKQLERLRAKSQSISNKEIEQLKALGFTTDQAVEALRGGSIKLDHGGLKKPIRKE